MDEQPRAAEAMECPGLEHPGINKTERPKQNDGGRSPDAPEWNLRGGTSSNGRRPPDWIIGGQVAARRPGQAHPRRNTEQGLPPPGLEQTGTSGGQMPRTGSSGADQATRASAPRTGSSGDKGRLAAPDWNIRGGPGSRSHRTQDSIVEEHVAGRCPGQEQPRQNKKKRPQPPQLDRLGKVA